MLFVFYRHIVPTGLNHIPHNPQYTIMSDIVTKTLHTQFLLKSLRKYYRYDSIIIELIEYVTLSN